MTLSSLSCNLYKTPHTRHANPLFNSKYQVPFRHRANTKFNALCARFIIKHAPWKKKKNRATSKESVGRFLCRGTELEKKKKKRNEETKGKGGYWRVVETIFFFQRQVCIRLLLLATISFGLVKNQKSILDRQKRKSSWVRSVATKYNRRLYFERSAYTLAAQPPGKVFCSWIFHLFFISPLFFLSLSLSSLLWARDCREERASFCRHSRFPCNPRSFAIHPLSPSFPRHPLLRLASSPRHAPRHNESPGLCVAVELNLKGPPYPKRAHSRRCIHLVGRKGDQKLNSYLEVFATSLSLRCMRVCVCARVCSCTFYLSVRFHVKFCSLDRYVRACSNTEYTRFWRSVVSCRSWFISFDVVFFSPRRWSKLLFDLYIRNWNYIFWLIFIREYSRIARRNRYLEGGDERFPLFLTY